MVALLVPRIWIADLPARCQGFRSVLKSIGELLCMYCRVLAFVLETGGVDLDFRSRVFTGVGEVLLEGLVLSALQDSLSVASLRHV